MLSLCEETEICTEQMIIIKLMTKWLYNLCETYDASSFSWHVHHVFDSDSLQIDYCNIKK